MGRYLRGKLVRQFCVLQNALVNFTLVLFDQFDQLGTAFLEKSALAVGVCDGVLGELWNLTDLLKAGRFRVVANA